MFGLLAPAAILPAIIIRLNPEIVRVLNRSGVKGQFFNAGMAAGIKGDPY